MSLQQSAVPFELRYNSIIPPGISSYIEQQRWDPLGQQNLGVPTGSNQGSQVRFDYQWNKGFVNNYETTFFMDINFNGIITDVPTADSAPIPATRVNTLQIDSSIHTIFQWMSIKSRNQQIEFIDNMDTLAAVLAIMNYSPNDRMQRSSEGFGGMHNPTGGNQFTRTGSPFVKGQQSNTGGITTDYYKTYFQPAAQQGYYYCAGDVDPFGQQIVDSFLAEGYNNAGTLEGAENGMVTRNLLSKQYVYGYQTKSMQNDFDTSRNVVQNPFYGGQVYSFPKVYGFEAPFVEAFSCTCFEAAFASAIYQNAIVNGVPNKFYLTQQTFAFPWLSAYFGILMPRQKMKLNPLKAWGQLQLIFKFNPYFVFSNNAAQKRGYNVTRFQIYLDVIQFDDQSIESAVSMSLGYGLIIQTCMWSYIGSENVNAGTYPGNSFLLSCNVTSMRVFLMLFMPQDFTKVSHVRKQKFISQNMTQWYLAINGKNFPATPLEGNAGTNFGTPNNLEFVCETLRAWHKLFKCDNNMSFFATNAALNYVQWNPLAGLPNQPPNTSTLIQNPSNIADCTNNFDTSWDINYYYEQTGLPRCIYSIGFDSLKSSYRYQAGLNTGPLNQISVRRQFTANGSNPYPNPSSVEYYVYFDSMVKLTLNQTTLVGYNGGNA